MYVCFLTRGSDVSFIYKGIYIIDKCFIYLSCSGHLSAECSSGEGPEPSLALSNAGSPNSSAGAPDTKEAAGSQPTAQMQEGASDLSFSVPPVGGLQGGANSSNNDGGMGYPMKVTVTTADVMLAGTDAEISIVLKGFNGTSQPLTLAHEQRSTIFKRGKVRQSDLKDLETNQHECLYINQAAVVCLTPSFQHSVA